MLGWAALLHEVGMQINSRGITKTQCLYSWQRRHAWVYSGTTVVARYTRVVFIERKSVLMNSLRSNLFDEQYGKTI